MGKGIFPKDKLPQIPAHPHCMCHLKPIVKGSLNNETPTEQIEDGGRKYLDSIGKYKRQKLMTIQGEKGYQQGFSWQSLVKNYRNVYFMSRISQQGYIMPTELKLRLQKVMDNHKIKGKILDFTPDIDVSSYSFDNEHINKVRKHGVTRKQAEKFIDNARIIIERWNGRSFIFIAKNGATYLKDKTIKISFFSNEYDKDILALLEVL